MATAHDSSGKVGRLRSGISTLIELLKTRQYGDPLEPGRVKVFIGLLLAFHMLFLFGGRRIFEIPVWSFRIKFFVMALLLLAYFAEHLSRYTRIRYDWIVRLGFFVQLCVYNPWVYLQNHTNITVLVMVMAILIYSVVMNSWVVALRDTWIGTGIAWLIYVLQPGEVSIQVSVDYFLMAFFSAVAGFFYQLNELFKRRVLLKTVSSIVGVMAHELRTPLAVISVGTDMLGSLKYESESDKQAVGNVTGRMDRAVRQLHSVIDGQIANARILSIAVVPSIVDLGAVVSSVHVDFPYKTENDRGMVKLTLDPHVLISGSEQLLRQTVVNLIKNAMTAVGRTGRSAVYGDVEVRVFAEGQRAVLSLRDRGVGISEDDRHLVFEPFYSTAPQAGHGLGLSFVKQVVRILGGSVTVESTVGVGTEFRLEFPLLTGTRAPGASPSA